MRLALVGVRVAMACGAMALAGPARAAEPPFVVALLVDTSGSVGAPELLRARRLAEDLLDGLPAGSEIAVFRFDDQAKLVLPRTTRKQDVRRALARLAPAGRKTALNDALYDGSKYVRETPGGRGALVLITDGVDEDSAVDLDDGLRLAEGARIPVYTIGVGNVQEKRLRRIAKLTGGDYTPIARARGQALGQRIGDQAASTAAAAAPSEGAPPVTEPTRVPAPSPSVASGPAPDTTAASSAQPARSRWPWLALGALGILGATAAVLATRRGREARCPGCGRDLPHPFSECASCASQKGGDESHTMKAADLSATVMTRLNTTEEYLEKTIALRDRPVLSVTRGPSVGQVFELSQDSSTSLGRARANDIVLDDVAVSNEHCRFRLEDGRFVMHDLKSTNGTFVNDKRVARHALQDGDVIQVGETWLTFKRDQTRV
jgi:hypothetical protein